jgi:transcriptional regulator with XRE-family HTH domain
MTKSFGDILKDHLVRGTRPKGKILRWTTSQFAEACGVSESTVRNWTNDVNLPPPIKLRQIEIILLGDSTVGDSPEYLEWRRELAEAYSRAKEQKRLAEQSIPERDATGARGALIAHREYLSNRWPERDLLSSDFRRIENTVKSRLLWIGSGGKNTFRWR